LLNTTKNCWGRVLEYVVIQIYVEDEECKLSVDYSGKIPAVTIKIKLNTS